jgi:hypothetical protein
MFASPTVSQNALRLNPIWHPDRRRRRALIGAADLCARSPLGGRIHWQLCAALQPTPSEAAENGHHREHEQEHGE